MYLVILSWSLPLSKKCSLAPKGLRSVSLHQGHQESSNTTTAGHSPAERQLKSLSGMSLRATDPKPLNMVFLRAPFSFVPPPCYEAAASSPLHYHIPPTRYFHDPKCPQPYYLLAPGCLHAISFSLSRSRALRYLSYVEESILEMSQTWQVRGRGQEPTFQYHLIAQGWQKELRCGVAEREKIFVSEKRDAKV